MRVLLRFDGEAVLHAIAQYQGAEARVRDKSRVLSQSSSYKGLRLTFTEPQLLLEDKGNHSRMYVDKGRVLRQSSPCKGLWLTFRELRLLLGDRGNHSRMYVGE